MKKTIGYIISVILSILIGVGGTLIFLSNSSQTKETIKTVKEVNVTETNNLSSSLEKIYNSVVVIETFNSNNKLVSSGTGFIYKKDSNNGYIITNQHVVDKASKIKITNMNNIEVEAKMLGSDDYMDIAVLSVDKSAVLQVASIGDNLKSNVGDTVFTVGSPLGIKYMGTVTKGIISGKNRQVTVKLTNGNFVMDVMQTDAAINPGNSGSPLLNINGEVIGVTSLKLVQDEIEGMGFALPIETVMNSVGKLEKGTEIIKPVVGVQLVDLTNKSILRSYNIDTNSIDEGAVVVKVEDNTPASKAKLKVGDVIIKINDDKIKDTAHFRYNLYKYEVNDIIKVTFIREGKENTVSVKLTEKLNN